MQIELWDILTNDKLESLVPYLLLRKDDEISVDAHNESVVAAYLLARMERENAQ